MAKILTMILTEVLGRFVTEKFLKKLVIKLIVEGLEYLKKKDLLKNNEVDEELINLALDVLNEQQ